MKISMGALAASAVFLVASFAAAARGQTVPVTVDLTPPICTTTLYDPRMPSRQMPAPEADELGVTVADFSCKANVAGQVIMQFPSGQDVVACVHVESIRITLRLNVTEWVDQFAGPKVLSHEDGHALIARHFYADSDQVASAVARTVIGADFYGSGPDAETAATDALNVAAKQITRQYIGRVRNPSELVQNFYDRITAHGTNQIDEMDAIERALHGISKIQITQAE